MKWKEIELSEVITDIAAGPFGSNLKVSCFVESGFPIIDGANLKGFKVTDNVTKFVTEEKARSLHRSIAKRNDVVVTISGTLGQIAYIPEDSEYEEYLCSQRQFRVTFDTSKVYVPYLVFYFHTYEGQNKILSFANQVGVPALSQPLKNFRQIKMEIPSVDEQMRIAGIVEIINNKIETNAAINRNLSEQAQTLVTDYLSQNQICTKSLSEISTIKYGKGLPIKKLIKKGYPVFGGNGIIGYYSKYLYKDPQILISCRGAASGNIWESLPFSYVTSNSLIIELNDYDYFEFIKQYLCMNPLYSYATGSAQPQITIDNIWNVEIPIPDKENIRNLTDVLKVISAKRLDVSKQNKQLAELRDTLLPRLMSGELDVSDLDI